MNPIPDQDLCRDPFDDALAAVINGDATERDWVILNDTLRTDPDARREYIRSMAFEGMLAREFAPLEEKAIPEARPKRDRWMMMSTIAATIILAATLAWQLQPILLNQTASQNTLLDSESDITHAVVTSLDDATGRFGGALLTPGMRLTGGTLELDHGLVGITFDTGAEVTLEGPAKLQVESENKTLLTAGRASTYCPEQARGFVMLTPTSYIRDLGTAFSVEVRDDHVTDLHVLEGEVEVTATGQNNAAPSIIRQSEGIRLAADGMQPIRFRSDHPSEHRKRSSNPVPPSIHWSFDEWSGKTTVDTTAGHSLTVYKGNKKVDPEATDGRFGTALHFDGKGSYAKSNFPGIGGSQARTIACWVRIQPDGISPNRAANSIVAWGPSKSNGSWQLGWNNNDHQGVLGAARVEFGEGYVIASSDIRDGRWHHLAVVYLGGPRPNVATHVRVYVDGKLELLSGRRQRIIDTDTTSTAARPLTLGRHLGGNRGKSQYLFEGDLDEVYIFHGALLPRQIVKLMTRNALPAPKS